MKKIALILLSILSVIAVIFGWFLFSTSPSEDNSSYTNLTLQSNLLNNSSWIYLTEEDFNGYLNGTYTKSVQTIITSLEEAIPVIFQTSNEKFGGSKNSTFIVASAFNSSNKVYVYLYDSEKEIYLKNLVSLENLLEDATAVYIYDETEGE